MKNIGCAGLAIRIALFYLTLAGTCQSAHTQPEIRFRVVQGTLVVVSLMANDEGPFDFVLDTGTNTTIVDPSLARQLSLTALDRIQLTTLAGERTQIRSSLRNPGAEPAKVENLEVLVQDLAELRKFDSHIEGIAGQDFLSHFNYLLDYRRHSLRIELDREIREAIEGDQVPMEVSENKMTVASEAQSGGCAKLHLKLDSAANSVVLIGRASQALSVPTQENSLEVTNNGEVGLLVGRVHELTVGSQRFHDIAVVLQPAGAADGERTEDGLLPTALFRSLYVNNREGFVVFNPRAVKN